MDKGIRQFVVRTFAEFIAARNASTDPKRDTAFRRDVMFAAIEAFDCTIAAAATHYNYALKQAQKETPELVQGLGRPPEKNNGGRKKKVVIVIDENEIVNCDAEFPEESEVFVDAESVIPELFVVKKKKGGETVAEGLSFDDAKELCSKAAAQKKAALYWIAA